MDKYKVFGLGVLSGVLFTIVVVSFGKGTEDLVRYNKMLADCEAKLVEENAPRNIKCTLVPTSAFVYEGKSIKE